MDFRLFSSKIVHAELLRAGYDTPSLRTVARWTSSGKAPGWAEQAVRELLGAKPVPDWERLLLTAGLWLIVWLVLVITRKQYRVFLLLSDDGSVSRTQGA